MSPSISAWLRSVSLLRRILELENNIQGLREANQNLEQNLIEATTTNQVRLRRRQKGKHVSLQSVTLCFSNKLQGFVLQMLTDEQQALQLAFTSLEEKFRSIQEDNNDLVKRYR